MFEEKIKLFDKYFEFRKMCFESNVEDYDSFVCIYDNFLNSCNCSDDDIVVLSSFVTHLREICGENDIDPNTGLLMRSRMLLQEYIDNNIDNPSSNVSVAIYALAVSHFRFVLGHPDRVFDYLNDRNLFGEYFDGARAMFDVYEKYRQHPSVFNRIEQYYFNIRQEVYELWSQYQSLVHLSASIFINYLDSDIPFGFIEERNNEELKSLNIPEEDQEKIDGDNISESAIKDQSS